MAIFALVLSVMMLVSTGLSAVSPAEDAEELQTAPKKVNVDPEQEYECLSVEDKFVRMNKKISKIEKELARKATQCAFSARLSDEDTEHIHGTLMFTKTISNDGEAYDKHTGVFTSPVDGDYVFHFHGNTFKNSTDCVLTLFYGEERDMFARVTDISASSSLSNVVDLNLKKSDEVRLDVTSKSSCYFSGRFTTFSGFKLP